MNRINQDLIDRMAGELQPVSPLKLRDGLLLVALASLAAVLLVHLLEGLWAGILLGQASAFFMIANGLLLVLGVASATSVVAMASPRVGNRHDAPKWTMAMAAVLPAAALVTMAVQQSGSLRPALRHRGAGGIFRYGYGVAAVAKTRRPCVAEHRWSPSGCSSRCPWQRGLRAGLPDRRDSPSGYFPRRAGYCGRIDRAAGRSAPVALVICGEGAIVPPPARALPNLGQALPAISYFRR